MHTGASGARTNLKVGDTDLARRAGNFFWSCPSNCLALKEQLVVLVSAFVMVTTVWWFLVGCYSTHGAPVPSHL